MNEDRVYKNIVWKGLLVSVPVFVLGILTGLVVYDIAVPDSIKCPVLPAVGTDKDSWLVTHREYVIKRENLNLMLDN